MVNGSENQGRTEGLSLLPQHDRLITDSGISPDVAAARGYRSVETKTELRRLGFGETQTRVPALLIPVWNAAGEIALYQIRPDEPRIIKGKPVKYETPAGARMALDVPPPIREWLRDPERPLLITEGIRKADAAVSLGLCCIALLGVWSWRGTNDVGGKVALPDWERIALNDRRVYIAFDSDIMEKDAVHAALVRLKAFLESRSAKVSLIYLPAGPGGAKVGLDDYLAAGHTVDELMQLATATLKTPTFALSASPEAGPYRIENGTICFEKQTKDGPVSVALCNFAAQVKEEIVLDDGVETNRAFLIEGTLVSGKPLPAVRIAADKFAGMAWVTPSWGLGAVVSAGLATRDRLREALQVLSPNVTVRQVYTHTGWRYVDGVWRFLTASGAVGAEGYDVDLGQELSRYSLPRVADNPAGAMRMSLNLLDVAPLTVSAPLWAGVFRAPLASALPLDLSLWMEGVTGSLKSTLAAMFLSHWGIFDRTKLPGAWSSTANSLERRAFVLQDVMFVIDDYAPSPLDRREMEVKAARLLRAQGNLAGRGRLRIDLTERPGHHPRGLVVGTGEQLPPGQSVRARMLVIDVDRRTVDLTRLSAAQKSAGVLPNAMAGYVAWLAPQMDTIGVALRSTFESVRVRALQDVPHLRLPEALAHMYIGVDCGLRYAQEIGACDATEAGDLRERCWAALKDLAGAQKQVLEEERPTRRFLSILFTLIQQQRVLVPHREQHRVPDRRDPLVGWHDGDYLYLIPDAVMQAVTRFAREADEPFPVNQRRIRQDLVREGIAVPDGDRTTATVRIGSEVHRVLRLSNMAVEAMIGQELSFTAPSVTVVTAVTGSAE